MRILTPPYAIGNDCGFVIATDTSASASVPIRTNATKPHRCKDWVRLVATEAQKEPQKILAALGYSNTSSILAKEKFVLHGTEQPKAKINNPERGCGQCDATGKSWGDWIDFVKVTKGFTSQGQAAEWVTEVIGFDIPERKGKSPEATGISRGLTAIGYNQRFARDYLSNIGLDPDKHVVLQQAGIKTAQYKCKGYAGKYESHSVLAIPVWGRNGSAAAPVNWIVSRTDGGKLPTFKKDGTPDEPTRNKTIGNGDTRSNRGLIIDIRKLDAMLAGKVPVGLSIKTEGVSDWAALIIHNDLPPHLVAWTNPFGCRDARQTYESARWSIDLFSEWELWTIHDADNPGQRGAVGEDRNGRITPGWCQRFNEAGANVKNILLPFEIKDNKGEDLRDFFQQGGTFVDIAKIAEKTEGFGQPTPAGDHEDTTEVESETPKDTKGKILVSVDDPLRLSTENLESYRRNGRNILFWRNNFYTHVGDHYEIRSESHIRARLRSFVEDRFRQVCEEETDWYEDGLAKGRFTEEEKKRPEKRKVSSSLIKNVLEATQSLCLIPDHVEMGCMLPERTPRNLWAVQNGLLDLDAWREGLDDPILPHTSKWFSGHVHAYAYRPDAECPQWLGFLDSVFCDPDTKAVDVESIETLRRWFGYCLMDGVQLQKMLILDGLSRSGKGVIARVLKEMIGLDFTCSPRLKDFAGDFGLQPLLGKRLAVIGDARLDPYRHDKESILETLLGVIGEDSMDVNVKRKDASTSVILKTKFMLLCNGIPVLNDPAMAIVNRVVILKFRNSFVGHEDTGLTTKLLAELDGIFRWSLDGYRLMRENLTLPQPESGKESLDNFRRAVAPIRGFVEEWCHLRDMDDPTAPVYMASRDDAFIAWTAYCRESGRDHAGTKANFLRQLTNTYPQIAIRRPGGSDRRYVLTNIELDVDARKSVTDWRQNQDANQDAKREASDGSNDSDF